MLLPIITVNDRGESTCQGYGYFVPDPGCSQSIKDIKMINLSTMGVGGRVVLPYISHISMCIPKGYGFLAVLV